MRLFVCTVLMMLVASVARAEVVAPEIGGSSGIAVVGLAAGGLMLLRARRPK